MGLTGARLLHKPATNANPYKGEPVVWVKSRGGVASEQGVTPWPVNINNI